MKSTGVVVLLCLVLATAAHAGPIDWLRSKLAPKTSTKAPLQISDKAEGPVQLKIGESALVRFDANTPSAKLPGGKSHYRRFTLSEPLAHALVRVRVLTQHHDQQPRYTVFAPEIYVLDGDGEIRDSRNLQPLSLSIRPFRRAELHGCLLVNDLHSFLIAADHDHLGKVYEFNARPQGASHANDGFYRGTSTMNVYLPFTGTGELVLRVQRGDGDSHC
ncbi:MAG: hypothetical protein L0H70_08835 [Xanthomonadales bacterium]|nr:hypothetical protein [Xanthomonadales bacterium]